MSSTAPLSPQDDRPVVAFFRSPLFNPSETFVQAQAAALSRYRPLMIGRQAKGNARAELADRLLISPSLERVRNHGPALVHAHFGTDGLIALELARGLRVPLVTTLHGYEVSRSRARMLLSGRLSWTRYALFRRRLMEGGALFLAVSEAIRRQALVQGFPPERTITHRIGVDLKQYRPGGLAESGLILHVGRLVEKKGTADLLEAFARIRHRINDARLVVIGDGPLRPSLERRSAALGLGDRVRFVGARPAEEIGGWMGRAWLIAAPSVTARDGDAEGLPTVLVEAAASGLPAVATDHSGIPEVVEDGLTGLIVPERRPDLLSEALMDLLRSPDRRATMAAAARARAERSFDLARQTALLEDRYDRLLGRL